MEKTEHILIVDGNVRDGKNLSFLLQREGYPHTLVPTAAAAVRVLSMQAVDLMLLELSLPDQDGRVLLKSIREWSILPILVVSQRNRDTEKAEVLDEGADDYITKPFSAPELMARIRTAFRHRDIYGGRLDERFSYSLNHLELSPARHRVFLEKEEIHLSPLEYRLLLLLFRYEGRVLSTTFIMSQLYGASDTEDTQALRTLVSSLRKKLHDSALSPRFIVTENGVGYRLADPQD